MWPSVSVATMARLSASSTAAGVMRSVRSVIGAASTTARSPVTSTRRQVYGGGPHQDPPPPPPPPPPENPPPPKPLEPDPAGVEVIVPAVVTAKPSIECENAAAVNTPLPPYQSGWGSSPSMPAKA